MKTSNLKRKISLASSIRWGYFYMSWKHFPHSKTDSLPEISYPMFTFFTFLPFYKIAG